jgi:hypothetical protein
MALGVGRGAHSFIKTILCKRVPVIPIQRNLIHMRVEWGGFPNFINRYRYTVTVSNMGEHHAGMDEFLLAQVHGSGAFPVRIVSLWEAIERNAPIVNEDTDTNRDHCVERQGQVVLQPMTSSVRVKVIKISSMG